MARGFSILYGTMVIAAVLGTLIAAGGKTLEPPLVRIAELEIDAGQLAAYRDALKEEIATSIRI
jgi:energy-converting hydrogenase Eha subunit E